MKQLNKYLIEKLSDENRKFIKYLIDTNKINDKFIRDLKDGKSISINIGKQGKGNTIGYNRWNINDDVLTNLLKQKYMSAENFKNADNITHDIIKIFANKNTDNKNCIDLLKLILKGEAQIDFKDIISSSGSNIYNVINASLENLYNKTDKQVKLKKDKDKLYKNCLKQIFDLTIYKTKNNSAIGKGELLLKLLLKQNKHDNIEDNSKGDIILNDKTKIEVKANKARIKGQFSNFGSIIDVYKKLYKDLTRFNDKLPMSYKYYFKSKDKGKDGNPHDLTELLIALNGIKFYEKTDSIDDAISKKSFCHCLIDALYEEYKNIKNLNISEKDLLNLSEQISKINFVNNLEKWEFDGNELINVVGAVQLYFYSQAENFDYFIVFSNDGYYNIITKNDCANVKKVIDLFSFEPPDGSSQGDVVRIFNKK